MQLTWSTLAPFSLLNTRCVVYRYEAVAIKIVLLEGRTKLAWLQSVRVCTSELHTVTEIALGLYSGLGSHNEELQSQHEWRRDGSTSSNEMVPLLSVSASSKRRVTCAGVTERKPSVRSIYAVKRGGVKWRRTCSSSERDILPLLSASNMMNTSFRWIT